MEWSKDDILSLLQLIRQRPIIWDANSKNRNQKKKAIDKVASLMGMDRNKVKQKWDSLKGQYRRERKKSFGSESQGRQSPTWYFYHEMESLMESSLPSIKIDNFNYSQISDGPSISDSSTIGTSAAHSQSPLNSGEMSPVPSSIPAASRNKEDKMFQLAIETLNSMNSNEPDDIAVFGLYVSAELRKFNPRLQLKARREITAILHSIENEQLNLFQEESKN